MRIRAQVEDSGSVRITMSITESLEWWRKLSTHTAKAVGSDSNYAANDLHRNIRETVDKVESTIFHHDESEGL